MEDPRRKEEEKEKPLQHATPRHGRQKGDAFLVRSLRFGREDCREAARVPAVWPKLCFGVIMASPPSRPAPTVPTVDLSPFLAGTAAGGGGAAEAARDAATRAIAAALQTTGFFRVVNHGVPAELMDRAVELSRDFFRRPYEEKLRSGPVEGSGAPVPVGYARQPESLPDKNEYLMLCPPETGFNIYPADPPQFREVLEKLYKELAKLASLVEDIVSGCMGLPPNFLRDYNGNRISDYLVAMRYFPVIKAGSGGGGGGEDTGLRAHMDGNVLTFVFQDDVAGLEVLDGDGGEWIQVSPEKGTIVVNVGDILQVMSNNRYKSALHRVVPRPVDRHSYAFFRTFDGGSWVEPLPQFTAAAGEKPQYKGFFYGEYLQHRMRNKTHPPARPEDEIDISHYAI
ncbi:hypothetical protein Taro_016682 [Colocasia esculenta]|uniref:Fe2OG dioxygenase domain-containing protein n=1 Tax=Colocasia esculenta TaxID=4460 RepID=A0A843UL06_COLES|nr:hypothetical protein [Colocasia esculenta]